MGARNRYYLEKGRRFIKKFMLLSTNCSIVLDINVAPRCIIDDEIFRLTNLMNLHVGKTVLGWTNATRAYSRRISQFLSFKTTEAHYI